ncbi:TraI domain-containing protein [Citrobacter sp. RHBSTW-01065]|nr:TraI domain-containing protein [Citrobacter sp. RHBSTW-01065]
MPASELLATTRRQQWLQSLWDYSSLPKADMYRQYYLAPLEHCVTLMQQFLYGKGRPYARPGGMADYMLETVSYAARLSKKLHVAGWRTVRKNRRRKAQPRNAVVAHAAMLPSPSIFATFTLSWRTVNAGFRYWMCLRTLSLSL